jgi:hypothetical protein
MPSSHTGLPGSAPNHEAQAPNMDAQDKWLF